VGNSGHSENCAWERSCGTWRAVSNRAGSVVAEFVQGRQRGRSMVANKPRLDRVRHQ
jgi:hypothetical protein